MSEKTFRIVAINGSPHDEFGNTAQLINLFRGHLETGGAELEEILLSEHRIEYCTGCAMCIQKGGCWIRDDHKKIVRKLMASDGIILASPVYFFHVTAQMKTFVDRCLGHAHRPRESWKPGLTVSVSAGSGETETAAYMSHVMRSFGAFSIGSVTGIALGAGAFLGRDQISDRIRDLAFDLLRAIREKRRYPATDKDLSFYQFIGGLAKDNPDFLKADHEHWKARGLFENFETYIGQARSEVNVDKNILIEWLEQKMALSRK